MRDALSNRSVFYIRKSSCCLLMTLNIYQLLGYVLLLGAVIIFDMISPERQVAGKTVVAVHFNERLISKALNGSAFESASVLNSMQTTIKSSSYSIPERFRAWPFGLHNGTPQADNVTWKLFAIGQHSSDSNRFPWQVPKARDKTHPSENVSQRDLNITSAIPTKSSLSESYIKAARQNLKHRIYRHAHVTDDSRQRRVGILMPSAVIKGMPNVLQGYRNFLEFFQVHLPNVDVNFLSNDDLNGLIELLQRSQYTLVVKMLNTGIYEEDYNDADENTKQKVNDDGNDIAKDFSSDVAYCHLAKELMHYYNTTIVLWPCPHMRDSSNFLASYEAISFAVRSIAAKLNWTQVHIYVNGDNTALPLAIAASLPIPYRIQIDSDGVDNQIVEDVVGKAVIITAPMNHNSTLHLLNKLQQLLYTKVLLIDIMATSFNTDNYFYRHLQKLPTHSNLISNLLLLTVLNDHYRYYLNTADQYNGIEKVQNFRENRRLQTLLPQEQIQNKAIIFEEMLANIIPNSTNHLVNQTDINEFLLKNALWLGIYFDKCVQNDLSKTHGIGNACKSLAEFFHKCTASNTMQHTQHQLPQHGEQNYMRIDSKKTQSDSGNAQLYEALNSLCQQWQHRKQLINDLRPFVNLFSFFDFVIDSILQIRINSSAYNYEMFSTKPPSSHSIARYDFVVLDVVQTQPKDSVYFESIKYTNSTSANPKPPNTTKNHYHSNGTYGSTQLKWRPLFILEQSPEVNVKTYITHSIQPAYDDWVLIGSAHLWQCGSTCWGIIAITTSILLIIILITTIACITLRSYFLHKRLSKGPHKIVLSANDFVFPIDSRRVDEGIEAMLCCWLQQLQEFGGPEVDKPDLLKGSVGSLKNLGFIIPGANNIANANGKSAIATLNVGRSQTGLIDMRARYNGDWVQLKEVPLTGSTELKAKAMNVLVMAHSLRHENINPLIGWLSDPTRTAMVFDFCSRGSLQDILIMDDIKLDWTFRLSLLTDLVRGMRYLHASPLRVHGALTSRNCVVDARWVLKITDYALPLFYDAQGITSPLYTVKDLLWTAPELLRAMKTHPHHHQQYTRIAGTPAGDVYSFGIIMQEVVVRGEPYCMLSLSADEIISKIRKPPPLIRPSVSKGAAPPEAINIMRQCWAEQAEMRPDFNAIYERFKVLNHGRKVNFVDTMFQMLEKYSNNLEELIRERTEQLDIERKKTEQLLNRMLPSSVAEKLKMGLAVEPEEFSDVTIYFSDIVGFTTIAAHCTPVQVVDLLNDLYTIFDATINAYNVYKVETIGDAYMVVSGLPVRIPDHADQIATMALDLLHQSGKFKVKHLPGVPLQLRIGLHTGPCCAGVVGLTMPRYCLFGDTVNTASRMESTGSSWRIHMSQETRDRLEFSGGYMIESRGLIDIKGKGAMHTYWLLGKKGFDKILPKPPQIGLDESLIQNSITLKAQTNKSRNSTNPSSSQSSSFTGEAVEVKVEVTPPNKLDACSNHLQNSYSLDSNSTTTTVSPSITLYPDLSAKTTSSSPQARKISDPTCSEKLLTPGSHTHLNRLPSSTTSSSVKLYKKIEEMFDLSSRYNQYKCLSPSESNLSKLHDSRFMYNMANADIIPSNFRRDICGNANNILRCEKAASFRLLRRQFSLDRDDPLPKTDFHLHQHQQHPTTTAFLQSLVAKSVLTDVPIKAQEISKSPKSNILRIHKQNSTSIAQDLEKIEEIPLSPTSSQQHSSFDSNTNRSPPSAIQSPTPVTTTTSGIEM